MWVLDMLDDIESDMSVFHRVEDIYAMHAPLFFSRVMRLAAYKGVIRARLEDEAARKQKRYGSAEIEGRPFDNVAANEGAGLFSVTKVGGES